MKLTKKYCKMCFLRGRHSINMTEINNREDLIDSRDVIDRIEELDEETRCANCGEPKQEHTLNGTGCEVFIAGTDEELQTLKALAAEGERDSSDWRYGATLVRESYFTEYCEELVNEIGDLPPDFPSYIVIDWKQTADNLREDYTEVDFDGVTYLVR